jgi:hypothetical protein
MWPKHKTPNNRCNLQYDDGRDAISKLLVERLVMPHLHATPCADASAHSRQYQQRGFRDAPFPLLRFPLVDAVHEERDEVEYKERDEYYLYHFETFINSLILSSLIIFGCDFPARISTFFPLR